MKIFVEIPVFRNDEFKVAAVKAIRSLSDPIMSLKDAKTMVETPGWHHIPNNVLKPLSMTKADLRNHMAGRSLDYYTSFNAIEAYGGRVMLYLHNGQPAGYVYPDDRPTPNQQYMDTLGNMLRNTEEAPSPKEYVEATQAIHDHLKSEAKPEDITRQIHAAMVHELKHYLLTAIQLREYKMARYFITKIAQYDKED